MKTVSLTVSQVFDIALKAYAAGKLGQAEKTCLKILSADPASAITLNLLGVIHMARGRNQLALAHYDRALALRPDFVEAWSNRGALLKAMGRQADALDSFDRALALRADHAGVINNRAGVLQELGRFDEALAYYDRALALQPAYPEALNNRGVVLQALGRHVEALESYAKALALRPDFVEALVNRGLTYSELARFEEALADYDGALALEPKHVDVLNNRAIALRRLGRPEEALASHSAALALRPKDPKALVSRGLTLHDLKRTEAAQADYDRAIALQPGHVDAFVNRGALLHELGRHDEALRSFERALALQPDNVHALTNRGVVLHDLARYGEALADHDQAISIQPGDAAALNNRGVTLHKLRRLEEALASQDQAISARQDYPEALVNRGIILYDLKRFDEAQADYDRAIAQRADYADAHFLKGLVSLVTGDFAQGWAGYEWRHQAPVARLTPRALPQPSWRGEDIAGKTILLHGEQGFGDSIQFCRYVPLVEARGARVVLEADTPLARLMQTLRGAHEVIAKGDPLPDVDIRCPLPSLPLAFETRLDTIPADGPYLSAPDNAAEAWAPLLVNARPLKIGLAWAGNPNHVRDRERSMDLRHLLPLFEVNATFVSLQKQLRDGEAGLLAQHGVLDVSDQLHDFADTAALISQLDLVIAVDTGVAHLAGALGKPVWIMLTHAPDWRWLLDRDDSPWYPTARLFRQGDGRDWAGVIAQVRASLNDVHARRGASAAA
ncbi:TPR repeat protein [Bradyrhizobium sp. STM 3843]|uniref:tetratricopeptide repeat protein n=1 Tax=Bradyrhizobium sp. STM 3843 TaxID=551947 RepID=UPI00024040BB|nr:tetratricopeptide repeat protein [Bradyrhizobium sp. STM 3843]CCE12199.1 TPR repeat protein [Bradyrhizobium sp. STM 3843]